MKLKTIYGSIRKNEKVRKTGKFLLKIQDRFNLGKAKLGQIMGLLTLMNTMLLLGISQELAILSMPFVILILIVIGIILDSTGLDELELGIKAKRNPEFKKLNKKLDKLIALQKQNDR